MPLIKSGQALASKPSGRSTKTPIRADRAGLANRTSHTRDLAIFRRSAARTFRKVLILIHVLSIKVNQPDQEDNGTNG
ncbi:hypothetical protein D3C74_357380 [compost metagenome]